MARGDIRIYAAGLAGILATMLLATDLTWAATPDDTNYAPKTVLNQRTYIWLLPHFWMAGNKSYGYFRIENTLDQTISIYLHCQTAGGSILEMTGSYTLGPHDVKIVDSRKYRPRRQTEAAVLVNCSLRSHSLASVRYLIRDGRFKNFGRYLRAIRPDIS